MQKVVSFLSKILSCLFLLSIVTAFFYLKTSFYIFVAFFIISLFLFFKNGNKFKLFLANILLLTLILSVFFSSIRSEVNNEVQSFKQDTSVNTNRLMQERLVTLREMIRSGVEEDSVLVYMYDTIETGEGLLATSTPLSYLDLGFTYEIADSLGIPYAKEKAIENFSKYCNLAPTEKTCQSLRTKK